MFILTTIGVLIPIILIPLGFLFVILVNRKPSDTFISTLYANFKGINEFELRIHQELRKTFNVDQVFLNYMFGKGDKTTQIDHLVITRKAIFVIESKDYKGTIHANINSQNWSQKLEYVKSTPSKYISISKYGNPYRKYYLKNHVDTHKLYNPILQNQGHVNSIKYHFGFTNLPIVNMVVFSNRGNLVMNEFDSKDTFVLIESELTYTIKAYLNTRPNVIKEADLKYIENLLICLNTNSEENSKEHISRLKNQYLK